MSKRNRSRLSRRLRRSQSRHATAPAEPQTAPSLSTLVRSKIELIAFSEAEVTRQQVEKVKAIAAFRGKFPLVWVNVIGLGDLDAIREIGELFGLHPLALEDVVHVHQRAKVDAYDSALYIVLRDVEHTAHFETDQVSIFLGNGFVLTFQERPGDNFDAVRSQLQRSGSYLRNNCKADYLVYRLIDAVIDGYFPLLEQIGDRLDEVDEQATSHPSPKVFSSVHQLRGDLLLLRRAIWPHREAINQLVRDPNPFVTDHTRTYLRDVYDHTVQLIDLVETYREICTDLRDFYMSTISNRMNEIMRVLTVIATIFIPLSFVAGLWGMNFHTESSPWNMPELKWYYGYPMALGVMSAVAGGMLLFFHRRGWLGRQDGGGRAAESQVDRKVKDVVE